jgi:hypothetical protein
MTTTGERRLCASFRTGREASEPSIEPPERRSSLRNHGISVSRGGDACGGCGRPTTRKGRLRSRCGSSRSRSEAPGAVRKRRRRAGSPRRTIGSVRAPRRTGLFDATGAGPASSLATEPSTMLATSAPAPPRIRRLVRSPAKNIDGHRPPDALSSAHCPCPSAASRVVEAGDRGPAARRKGIGRAVQVAARHPEFVDDRAHARRRGGNPTAHQP